MQKILKQVLKPVGFRSNSSHLIVAIPRILGGLSLSIEFGSPKFGMPWSANEELGLFQVAAWFPEDVSEFGIPYSWAPWLFAWLGAATEAIGGLLLAFGMGTRVVAGLIAITMCTAIFFQKWPNAMEYGSSWPLLPAAGFLWIAIYSLVLGCGKYGLDTLLFKRLLK
ncbi:MAG: DoxX family protein [Bacteroidota bacterium]